MTVDGVESVYASNVLLLSDIIINLTAGKTYTFTVESRNLVGYSQKSITLDIVAA